MIRVRLLDPGPSLGVLFALASGPAMAQHLGQAVDEPMPWGRIAAVLALGLVLAVGAGLVLRARIDGAIRPGNTKLSVWSLTAKLPMFKAAGGASALRVTDTVRLSHQTDLCLIEWRDREMLIAATAQGVVVLGERAVPTASETAA